MNFKAKIFVAGDLMLDRFEYGKVSRISPEAPVPVFCLQHEKRMLGGVGNVASNLMALGCKVELVGAIGNDEFGEEIKSLAKTAGIKTNFVVPKGFDTVVKTRLIAGNNHLLRADQESGMSVVTLSMTMKERIQKAIARADAVLISDYLKGFLSADTCREIIDSARAARKPVLVDPKGTDWERYQGATLVKPNLKEFSSITGKEFDLKRGFEEIVEAARSICKKFAIRNLLITLSEHGMLLVAASRKLKPIHVPAETREVFDVSGAGDTALAALGAALASGRDLQEALKIANVASGIVVSKLGTATVTAAEITAALARNHDGDISLGKFERKLVSKKEIGEIIAKRRASGQRIGFTNGCFDCCHLGHLYSLVETKKRCDVLVVALNSDDSVRRHKGPQRPVQDEYTRALVLASMEVVDYVVIFNDDMPIDIVKTIRPDVIVKEGYPIDKWPEGRLVKRLGGEAVELKRLEGHSTSALVKRMRG